MQINPENFKVTELQIRQRFDLSECDMVIDYGYEHRFGYKEKSSFQKNYDMCSLYVRTQPDFFITKGGNSCLVEAKQRTNTAEAVQLYFNQQLSKNGINVIYSFPEFNIPAQFITIEEIFVPQKYQEPFDRFIKDEIITSLHDVKFTYISATKGSGDPFIVLDEEYLREFSQTLE